MGENKWETLKMKEKYWYVSIDEIAIFALGASVFVVQPLLPYRLHFIGLVILWYWLKIRHAESKVHKMKQKIYNTYYDNCQPIPQNFIDNKTAKDREPLNYELQQLEYRRIFLVDKFVIINVILVVLIQIFIES